LLYLNIIKYYLKNIDALMLLLTNVDKIIRKNSIDIFYQMLTSLRKFFCAVRLRVPVGDLESSSLSPVVNEFVIWETVATCLAMLWTVPRRVSRVTKRKGEETGRTFGVTLRIYRYVLRLSIISHTIL